MEQYTLNWASAEARAMYGMEHSALNQVGIMRHKNPVGGANVHVVLVKESLGF